MTKKYQMTLWQALLLFIAAALPGLAQNLRGRVTDAQSGSALPGVAVAVAGTTQGVSTDNGGNYTLPLRPGTYSIQFSFIGFTTQTRQVTIGSSDETLNVGLAENVQSLTDVVVVGSRSTQIRSSVETVAPVDIISSRELQATGQIEPTQMINLVAPSFNSARQTVADGTDHIDPATLRGLGPDQVLVLLNGKRRHNQALINVNGTVGRGSVGTDLNTIPRRPSNALKCCGKAPRRSTAPMPSRAWSTWCCAKTRARRPRCTWGSFTRAMETMRQLGLYHGIRLGNRGVIGVAADIRLRQGHQPRRYYTGPVYVNWNAGRNAAINETEEAWLARRQSLYEQDQALIAQNGFSLENNMQIGNSAVNNFGGMLNGNYKVAPNVEVYFSGVLNHRKGQAAGFYRYPFQTNAVISELYPNGFMPQIHSTIWDRSVLVGVGGELGDGWRWDLSNVFGGNAFRFDVKNSNNASQFPDGANAQTEFYAGTVKFNQNTSDIGISKDFGAQLGLKSFNVASGLSFRLDNYQIEPGEEASYRNFDPASGRAGGAQVFPGFQPDNEVNANRNVLGAYLDLETDLTDNLLLNAAGRYENYSDFGGNLAGKLSARYKFADFFSLRGTIANGFRAPSIHQRYFSSIATVFVSVPGQGLQPRQQGTFPNNSEVAGAFGIPSLTAEKSTNYSLGITSQPLSNLSITVDAYQIDIRDRIVLTGQFQRGASPAGQQVTQLLDAAGQTEVQAAVFFTNAVNTRTRGIDVVASSDYRVGPGTLTFSLAGNVNETNVRGEPKGSTTLPTEIFGATLFNRQEEGRLEWAQPRSKFTLGALYRGEKFGGNLRVTRFGDTKSFDPGTEALDESFRAKLVTDLNLNYQINRILQVTVGVNNLFDVYPDPLKVTQYPTPGNPTSVDNSSFGRFVYSRNVTQFGFNGGYYFVSLSARL
jgi:iron complex outermembrane receptor protein